MCLALCCSLTFCTGLAAVLAVLVGIGSYLSAPLIGPDGKPFVIKNSEVRSYLQEHTLKGGMARHPRYSEFPVKGVYMFQYLGPASLIDFSHLSDWDEEENTFELDMSWCMAQSGIPWRQAGLIGPFVPGALLGKAIPITSYKNKWYCPRRPMQDGQNCSIVASFFGGSYETDIEGKLGLTQWFIKRAGGKLWVRDTTFWQKLVLFHHYNLHRVVDENGSIDETNFELLMEKLGGQDLYYFRPELAPKRVLRE